MNDHLHSICRNIDPEEVEKLMSKRKHIARKKIIKKFLIKSYYNNFKNIPNKYDYGIVKNTYNFSKMLLVFSGFISLVSYKYFFNGIYEIRSFYLNAANIPLPIKLSITGLMGYYIFEKAWMNYSYNEDIYELAIKDMQNEILNKKL